MTRPAGAATPDELAGLLRAHAYLPDAGLATVLWLAITLGRPVLLEGEAGVGKTEVAKVLATALGRELIRLQCYEGIDVSQALYEWDYARQLVAIRAAQAGQASPGLFGSDFLVERPLLRALRAGSRGVLLIDELDRADDEFEAFLLEVLSEFAVTVPELGRIAADEPPIVVVTSNRTRDLHDALKRRCLYHWIDHPSLEREVEIVRLRAPEVPEGLARGVAAAVERVRTLALAKRPGVAETIDWARSLAALGSERLDESTASATLGAVLKDHEDTDLVLGRLGEVVSGLSAASADLDPAAVALGRLVTLGRELRRRGLGVGPDRVLTFCRGAALLEPTRENLYWCARATLVSSPNQLPVFDAVFAAWWADANMSEPPGPRTEPAPAIRVIAVPEDDAHQDEPEGEPAPDAPVGMMASRLEALRHKSFAELEADERAAANRLIRELALRLPDKSVRRLRRAPRGHALDLRATLRSSVRTDGELLRRAWRRRRRRPRPLLLLLDVSGSMSSYSRALLQFGFAALAAGHRVEVFCFGTRLTRVTRVLRARDPDRALREVTDVVQDFDGGTRIGESLRALINGWGQHAVLRGSVVVICSDGLDRGDPELLSVQMARLQRLAHTVVWVNPLRGTVGYEPLARGMAAALPHVDRFLPGHDLASLEELAQVLER